MNYLISFATGIGLGVIILSPGLIVLTAWDWRDRRRHRAEMARWRPGQ